MVFRIGINLGDVMVEGDDIYGDGVNVAARLEKIAEPGGLEQPPDRRMVFRIAFRRRFSSRFAIVSQTILKILANRVSKTSRVQFACIAFPSNRITRRRSSAM